MEEIQMPSFFFILERDGVAWGLSYDQIYIRKGQKVEKNIAIILAY